MTLADGLTSWLAYRLQMADLAMIARSTYDSQAKIVLVFQRAPIGAVDVEAIRKSNIDLWMGERLQTCAPITVRGELDLLAQAMNWMVDERLLKGRPRFPQLQVDAEEADLPGDDAFQFVIRHVPQRHAKALEFMMLTGVSPHELERLQVCDLGTAGIGIGQRPDFAVKRPSRRRWVPLNGRATILWFEVSAGLEQTASPFPKVDTIERAIQRARGQFDEAPIGACAITPKLMRRWFASKVASQHPEHVLQRLLGHTPGSPITRKHYVRSTSGQTTLAVEELRL